MRYLCHRCVPAGRDRRLRSVGGRARCPVRFARSLGPAL